jgi:hypothetical protein
MGWLRRLFTKPEPVDPGRPARLSLAVNIGTEGVEVTRWDSTHGGMVVLNFGGDRQSITLHPHRNWAGDMNDPAPLDRLCEALANPTRRIL